MRAARFLVVAAVWSGLIAGAGSLIAQSKTAATTPVFTAEQADRGKTLYGKACASCHLDNLEGAEYAPALVGEIFLGAWSSRTVDEFYARVRGTMPADAPGTLSRQNYLDIVAYILQANRFASGPDELKPEPPEALASITIGKL